MARDHLVARILALALILGAMAFLVVTVTPRGSSGQEAVPAQAPSIPSLPPTVPCTGCGPSGQPGTGLTAFAYPEHFCLPASAPNATYAIFYGLGRRMTTRATFYGEIQGIVRTLDTLSPGQVAVEFPAVEVPPGETFQLIVYATAEGAGPNGTRLPFGNGTNQRPATLTCDCVQQVTTVVTTTVPGVTTTISNTTTTTNTSDTVVSNSVPRGTLPATR